MTWCQFKIDDTFFSLQLLDTIYACVFILMSTYYDNFSNGQHIGYFTQLWANILVIIAGFLSIHFLTLSPTAMKVSYGIFVSLYKKYKEIIKKYHISFS